MDPLTLLGLVVLSGILLAFYAYLLRWFLRRRSQRRLAEGAEPTEQHDVAPGAPSARVPAIPQDLVDAAAVGEAVLFAGSGLSASAGLPTRDDLLAKIVDIKGESDPAYWAPLGARLATDPTSVADVIASRIPPKELRELIASIYANRLPIESRLVNDLAAIDFAGVVTRNYDQLVEKAFARLQPEVLTLTDAEGLARATRGGRFPILKLHGGLDDNRGFLFTADEYRKALYQSTSSSSTIASLFFSNSFFFVGASPQTIQETIGAIPANFGSQSRRHFALVPWSPEYEIDAERLKSQFGIELLPYLIDPGHRAAGEFIRSFRDRVARARITAEGGGGGPAYIKTVQLENIGPFKSLRLEFQPGWNLILGNNGSGKSSILRAIALATGGDDPRMEATAGRFLRSDATRGSVDVDTGKDVYQTQLVRDASRVALRVARPTGLQAGTWSVIGFPPVRGASLRESPPSGRESMRLPVVDDIVPMIGRDSDGRLDDIRQWILGLSMTIDGSTSSAVDRRKARQTRDSFFKILGSLMPDLIVEFARIDQRSWQVIVRTQDGEMPLDLVSQGTSSIIGWVGTLLQRLQEINQDSGNPTQARAIVLIDEIDAHMHPEWQKTLVPLLKDNFPNVQFIATTHSPLVAGAMEEQEVIRLVRVGAAIEARGVGERLRGLRADQILTSRAFDLETTTDFRTDELQAEYSGLLAIPDRSDSQESAFRALSARVRRNLAPIGDSFEARLQSRKRDEELEARERSLEPEERRAISKELSRILQEATKALGLPAADAREESRDGASMSDLEVLAADDEPVDDDAAEVAEIDGGAGITENDDDATAGADGGTRSAGGMA